MKRIAVVEDEVYMREELCDMLQKDGYLVEAITELDVYKRQVHGKPFRLCQKHVILKYRVGIGLYIFGVAPCLLYTSRQILSLDLRLHKP